MLLVVTTIYVDPAYCKKYLDYAKQLAKFYVPIFAERYGKEYVSHNVHSFIHLDNDVEKFGALDKFSAFKYENFYQILAKLIREGEKPLQQLVNRCAEMKSCGFWPDIFKSPDHVSMQHSQPIQTKGVHCDGPLLKGFTNPQFHSCTVQGGCTVKFSQADKCCILHDGSVVLVENFATSQQGQTLVIGRTPLKKENLYEFPCESSMLGIVYAHTLSNLRAWPASLISQKCVHMPWKSGFAIFPLHHKEK